MEFPTEPVTFPVEVEQVLSRFVVMQIFKSELTNADGENPVHTPSPITSLIDELSIFVASVMSHEISTPEPKPHTPRPE